MYPIKFNNIYFNKIWGGRDFESFRNNLPKDNIGESWDVACHENGTSIVENGEFKGLSFNELIAKYGHSLVGTSVSTENFPLLVKLINSKDRLSVQVHPGDEYSLKYENENGKTEAWYVIDAKEDAKLIIGTKDCTKEVFEKAISENTVEDYLNIVPVKKGDFFLINSGMVHAICEGVIIAEIQQNSDITYRVYDYGRPREIHVDKALDVIDFNLKSPNLSNIELDDFIGYKKATLCTSDYFNIEKIVIDEKFNDSSNKERFFILTAVDGCGVINWHTSSLSINLGDSIFIPSHLGDYSIEGSITLLKSYPI